MPKKILIVDDDEELCEELSEILKGEGYETQCVFDGLEGRKQIEKYDYDLLILDFKMPGLNGIEILKNIKKKGPKCKLFFVSGKPFIEKSIESENLSGFVDCVLQKPFDIETLLSKIKTHLS